MSRNDQDNAGAVSSLVMPEAWTEKGSCARALNPDAWFPERGEANTPELRLALRVCADCPVKDLCLKEALAQGPSCEGIWGGTRQSERCKMLRMGCTTLEEYKALTDQKNGEPAQAPEQDTPTVEPAAPVPAAPVKDKTTTFPDVLSEVMHLPGNYTIGSLFSGY